MSRLTDFLLARITEDEGLGLFRGYSEELRARVLAECQAKRMVVATCLREWDAGGGYDEEAYVAREIMHALVRPYADHPDCREEWKP